MEALTAGREGTIRGSVRGGGGCRATSLKRRGGVRGLNWNPHRAGASSRDRKRVAVAVGLRLLGIIVAFVQRWQHWLGDRSGAAHRGLIVDHTSVLRDVDASLLLIRLRHRLASGWWQHLEQLAVDGSKILREASELVGRGIAVNNHGLFHAIGSLPMFYEGHLSEGHVELLLVLLQLRGKLIGIDWLSHHLIVVESLGSRSQTTALEI